MSRMRSMGNVYIGVGPAAIYIYIMVHFSRYFGAFVIPFDAVIHKLTPFISQGDIQVFFSARFTAYMTVYQLNIAPCCFVARFIG